MSTSDVPAQLSVVAARISVERLAPYRSVVADARDPLAAALALYGRSAVVSGQFWALLGYVEVIVRNALHDQLTARSAADFGEPRWYLDPDRVLSGQARSHIAAARVRVAVSGKSESPGRVVAELSFGLWRFLLAARYERSLWRTCLHRAFPGQGRRKAVHAKIAVLHELRNRIAHHEPIHNRPLGQLYNDALTVAGWICPTTRDWLRQQQLVPSLDRRVRKRDADC
ncbi:MAG: hypothetical protein ACRDPW_00670 [Mycobacteriales bacterium]